MSDPGSGHGIGAQDAPRTLLANALPNAGSFGDTKALGRIATILGFGLEPDQDERRDKRSRIGLVRDPREKQSC
jgi:hypothetical protein